MSLGALTILMGELGSGFTDHVGQELLQVEQPRSEQQNLRWQTSLVQGAQAEEQSRTGVQAMCQLSEKCQDGTRHIFQEAEVQRCPSTSYCSDRE